ncbi:MAG: DegV family protein [Lachnospiraceae bacterium]|nr:DegV family protein [Lachnospiraceae bacterium]
MSQFQIFSDGAADIPIKVASENSIEVIPFYVSLDGENYLKEMTELSLDVYYKEFVEKHLFPKTSLPSVQDYIDAFTPALESGKDILCFNITTTLSGSHQSANTAGEILSEKFPEAKIYIMNSWLATGAQEFLVVEAARMQRDGLSIDEIKANCEKLRKSARIMFMVGGLDHLQKGGRIGKVSAAAGGILKIKPLIELKDGEISLAGVTRSRKGGMKKLAEITNGYFEKTGEKIEDFLFTVGETNTPEEIESFQNELRSVMPDIVFEKDFLIGATISAHTGPGTLGVCFLKKYDRL